MSCNNCDQHWFWKKIGRCNRCMKQLAVLCAAVWVFWFSWGSEHIRQIETIAILCFGIAFHGLLLAHLWMKWVILPRKKGQ